MPFPIVSGRRPLEIGSPGEMRQRLNALILRGEKRAAAGVLRYYEVENELVESVGELLTLVDDEMQPIATVMVVRVEIIAFADVPFEFAQAEGEGDESIDAWREGHRQFWTLEGEVIDDLTPVVLMWFELAKDTPTAASALS